MLGEVLPAEAFAFLLITIRLAALVMVMPVFSDSSIPSRIRISLAVVISLVIYPTISPMIPAMPDNVLIMAGMFLRELTIGLILGLVMRFLLSSMHTAGTIIAFQTGLAAAQSFDPAQGAQSAIVAAFMNLLAITLIIVTDLHHLMLMGLVHSYYKFPVGEAIQVTDFAMVAVQYVSSSFLLGFQLSAPFLVYGIVFNLGLGLIARMVPSFQVFFVGMPLNIFMGFALMMILTASIMRVFLEKFEALLTSMVG